MRTVIFDLDGTLADTAADLVAAANACFRELGLGAPLDPLADARTAFLGGRAMLRLGLERAGRQDEGVVEAQYPRLLAQYGDALCVRTALYPGAAEAVRALRAEGVRCGICTNKPEALALRLVAMLGVADLFGSLVGADTLAVRKPDPAPYRLAVERAGGRVETSLLVGDTETDLRTARAAGVPVALVGFGPEGPGIARLAPDHLLARFDDLPRVVRAVLGAPAGQPG